MRLGVGLLELGNLLAVGGEVLWIFTKKEERSKEERKGGTYAPSLGRRFAPRPPVCCIYRPAS